MIAPRRPALRFAAAPLALALALAGCANANREAPANAPPPDVAAILANPQTDADYRETKNCLYERGIDVIEIVDDTMALFHGKRANDLWLNRFLSQCLGLEADMIVDMRAYGGSLCRMDRLYGRPRYAPLVPYVAECRLGNFQAIDEQQAEALRVTVEERRQVDRAARKAKRRERGEDGDR